MPVNLPVTRGSEDSRPAPPPGTRERKLRVTIEVDEADISSLLDELRSRLTPAPSSSSQPLLTIQHVADRLDISHGTAYQLVVSGAHDLVFKSEVGKPMQDGQVSWTLHQALERAGLPRIRIHDLRYTAATQLLERGVHPKVVQEMLGHSTVTLTLDTYSHVIPGMHLEAAKEMQRLFDQM